MGMGNGTKVPSKGAQLLVSLDDETRKMGRDTELLRNLFKRQLGIIGCAVAEIREHFDLFEIEAGARPATQGPKFQIPSRISHIQPAGGRPFVRILFVLRHVLPVSHYSVGIQSIS